MSKTWLWLSVQRIIWYPNFKSNCRTKWEKKTSWRLCSQLTWWYRYSLLGFRILQQSYWFGKWLLWLEKRIWLSVVNCRIMNNLRNHGLCALWACCIVLSSFSYWWVCMCVHQQGSACTMPCVWKAEDKMQESSLFFQHVGPTNWT